MKKKTAGLLAVMFAVMTVLTGCSGSNKLDNTAEAINVDGVSVPMGEVNFFLRYQEIQMHSYFGSYFGDDFMNQDLTGSGEVYGVTMRDTVVDSLEELYLIEAKAEELGISLSEENDAAIADAVNTFLSANDSTTLEAMSADQATVTHILELLTLQGKAYESLAGTVDTDVPDEEVAQKRITYVRNSTEAVTDDDGNEVELTDEEKAEKKAVLESVLADAEENGDLEAAAEAQELNAVSTTYGQADTYLDDAMKAAADQLSDGEYSGIVEGEDGYYIVYMESTFDEEATESSRQSVLNEREQEAYSNWVTSQKEAAEITVNDEELEKISFERIFNVKTAEETDAAEEEAAEEETSEDASEE